MSRKITSEIPVIKDSPRRLGILLEPLFSKEIEGIIIAGWPASSEHNFKLCLVKTALLAAGCQFAPTYTSSSGADGETEIPVIERRLASPNRRPITLHARLMIEAAKTDEFLLGSASAIREIEPGQTFINCDDGLLVPAETEFVDPSERFMQHSLPLYVAGRTKAELKAMNDQK